MKLKATSKALMKQMLDFLQTAIDAASLDAERLTSIYAVAGVKPCIKCDYNDD